MFVFHMIAVDSEFGGRGIGTELVLRGMEHATRHGFQLLTGETTGIASAKIFQVKNVLGLLLKFIYPMFMLKCHTKRILNVL